MFVRTQKFPSELCTYATQQERDEARWKYIGKTKLWLNWNSHQVKSRDVPATGRLAAMAWPAAASPGMKRPCTFRSKVVSTIVTHGTPMREDWMGVAVLYSYVGNESDNKFLKHLTRHTCRLRICKIKMTMLGILCTCITWLRVHVSLYLWTIIRFVIPRVYTEAHSDSSHFGVSFGVKPLIRFAEVINMSN